MQETKNMQYKMIMTTEYVEDSGMVTAYGIGYRSNHGAGKGRQAIEQVIPNISTRPAFVEELVGKLNTNGADPLHLRDFIYDFLP